jgi:hypothetical protein
MYHPVHHEYYRALVDHRFPRPRAHARDVLVRRTGRRRGWFR